jgi:hypothetical protein
MFVEKMVVPVGNYVFIAGINVIYYIIMLQVGKLAGIFGRSL